MPSTWSAQALQAQAVAARSYALATRKIGAPYDAYADSAARCISASRTSRPRRPQPSPRPRGRCSSSAARSRRRSSPRPPAATESSLDWTGTAVPYLISVPDPYDDMSPYHNWGPVGDCTDDQHVVEGAGADHRRHDGSERGGPRRQAQAHDAPRTTDAGLGGGASRGDRPALDVVHGRRDVTLGARA